jgi:ABC-type Mn2+/Zn2+ transport system permease subunit
MVIKPKAAGLAAGIVGGIGMLLTVGCFAVLGKCGLAADAVSSMYLGGVSKDIPGAILAFVYGFIDFFIVGFFIAWLINYFEKKV